jgi:hypothetical protein
MRTKFYEVSYHDEDVMLTIPIDEQRAVDFLSMIEVIAIKGKIPQVGDKVKIRKYPGGEKVYASVHEVSPDGIPVRVKLEDGKVIELVGYLVQLINLIEAMLNALRELFNKSQDTQLAYLPMIKTYEHRWAKFYMNLSHNKSI